MNNDVRWCCPAFESHYLVAGERGIAVLIERDLSGVPLFILQARAFGQQSEPGSVNLPFPMSRVTETGLNYCPWCGVSLQKWYRKFVDGLIRPGLRMAAPATS